MEKEEEEEEEEAEEEEVDVNTRNLEYNLIRTDLNRLIQKKSK